MTPEQNEQLDAETMRAKLANEMERLQSFAHAHYKTAAEHHRCALEIQALAGALLYHKGKARRLQGEAS
jgi:hypothetical protein